MIRRPHENGFLLITQQDHATLSGDLAAHYGTGRFLPPDPLEPTLLGIGLHDSGWPIHDDRPTPNPQGLPLHVFETPPEISIPIWTASADRAAARHPYAGLLVSLHGMALSLLSATHHSNLPGPHQERLRRQFELNRFQHQEVERQELLRGQLGMRIDLPLRFGLASPGTEPVEDQLISNFRLLQAMDRLSLAALCHEELFPAIELIPAPGAAPIQIRLTRQPPNRLLLSPWIFETTELTFTLEGRVVPPGPYPDAAALQAAFATASPQPLQVHFAPLAGD
jgi:hypothetical protein